MNRTPSTTPNRPIAGAAHMLGAGIAFAAVNTMTPIVTWQLGVASSAVVFWQYLIATLVALPLILRIGLANLRTRHPWAHEARALVSALGVQVFVFGFASGVPVWQMVALAMTSPFFVITGAVLFLGERPGLRRLAATAVGFTGALMVSGFGSSEFSLASLLPVAAAALWAAATILTKWLSREETPEALTLSMLVLITPNHFGIGMLLGLAVAAFPGVVPAALATGFDIALPGGAALALIVGLGVATAAAQYFFALAYRAADATYLQPFDDLKLPLNTLLGWLVLSQVPSAYFWPGAVLILGASGFLLWSETARRPRAVAA